MIIHTMEECQQWIVSKKPYSLLTNAMFFEPYIEERMALTWHVADICGKSFQHNIERIKQNIEELSINFPKIVSILEGLHIFFSPKPSADTANACANNSMVCYFSRATQIPYCMTDYITVHELGHVVEQRLCGIEKFREYLELRKAEKGMCEIYDYYDEETEKTIYKNEIDFLCQKGTQEEKAKYYDWDMSPAEWFAEDFRYLFGVDKGDKFWGFSIEPPDKKIREFFLSL